MKPNTKYLRGLDRPVITEVESMSLFEIAELCEQLATMGIDTESMKFYVELDSGSQKYHIICK